MRASELDTEVRARLAGQILTALERAAPGSAAELRGSLAEGRADAYSDIDLLWEVPDELFQAAVGNIYTTLANVHPIAALRSAIDYQRSDRRRLIFVEFEGLPLFWRVDIDILAASVQRDFNYDTDNPAARGDDWSLTHSALMNAVATIKALLRGQDETAGQLLRRAYERVGLAKPEGEPRELVLMLVRSIETMDPAQARLAGRIIELHREVFGET